MFPISFLISILLTIFSPSLSIINISNYAYPHPEPSSSSKYTIAIFATNDIHGYALPQTFIDKRNNEKYVNGSIEYMSTIINAIHDEWKERFIWLDGGDHGSGGIEFTLSNGQIMTDFFNNAGLTATTLGNHEFTYGIEFLKNQMQNSTFDYIVSNIIDKQTGSRKCLPNQKISAIYKVGKVNIGVIGLTHLKIANESAKANSFMFLSYRDIIISESKYLHDKGANAVVLLAHFGAKCSETNDIYELKLRTSMNNNNDDLKNNCENFEGVVELLESLPKGTINAVVSGHVHQITHHWIQGHIPIVSSSGISYGNVIYLTFDKVNFPRKNTYIPSHALIEGPIPICSKVFSISKSCPHFAHVNNPSHLGTLMHYSFHGTNINADDRLSKQLIKWKRMLTPLYEPICYTETVLERCVNGDNTLHNIISDTFRKVANADFAIIHSNCLRTKWLPGELNYVDMFNMFPFTDTICSFEMSGKEVMRMIRDLSGNENVYSVSGLRVTYQKGSNRFIDVIEDNGNYIIKDKMYIISSSDYLVKGNIEFRKVIEWYHIPKNYKCYITAREAVAEYLKEMKVIKANAFVDPFHPRNVFID